MILGLPHRETTSFCLANEEVVFRMVLDQLTASFRGGLEQYFQLDVVQAVTEEFGNINTMTCEHVIGEKELLIVEVDRSKSIEALEYKIDLFLPRGMTVLKLELFYRDDSSITPVAIGDPADCQLIEVDEWIWNLAIAEEISVYRARYVGRRLPSASSFLLILPALSELDSFSHCDDWMATSK